MKTVTESIFNGTSIIPLADVQHIEKRGELGVCIVMKSTTWCKEVDDYNNAIHLSNAKGEAERFTKAWCRYRSELESDTLMDLSPKDKVVSSSPGNHEIW